MSKKKTLILIVALEAIVLVVIGFACQQAAAVYRKSLAAPLVLEVQPSPTGDLSPISTSQPQTPPQTGTCGQSGVMTILFLARDKSYGGNWPY